MDDSITFGHSLYNYYIATQNRLQIIDVFVNHTNRVVRPMRAKKRPPIYEYFS